MARAVRRGAVAPTQSVAASKLAAYLRLKAEGSALLDSADSLKRDLMALAEAEGVPDEKGSLRLALPYEVTVNGVTYRGIKRERRHAPVVDVEAARLLIKEKGLLDRVFPEEVVERFDQDELYVLNQEGLISDAELDALTYDKITWAFKPEAAA